MNWEKLGQVYEVNNDNPYLLSHASNPIAIHIEDDVYRVFYSGRDKDNKSSVSYVDIDIINNKVVYDHKKPLVVYGGEGSFDSHGISIGNCYRGSDGKNYILYMAWQIRNKDHWRGDVGRLELIGNDRLIKNPDAPFMEVDDKIDLVSLSYPYVIFHEGLYKMWYGSTYTWHSENGEMIHVINYATSKDAENWERHGLAIPFELGVAQAFSRPTVIIEDGIFHMWFSYRSGDGTKYRIGYAASEDGVKWERKNDEAGIDVSDSGWDSEMICYPFVIKHKGELYMFYNGNSNGKEGFGLARQIK